MGHVMIGLLDGHVSRVYTRASAVLPAKSQPTGDVQRFGAPVATFAVKHNVVVVFPRSPHFKFLLEVLWGQLQRLLQVAHWHSHTYKRCGSKNPMEDHSFFALCTCV